MSEEEVAWQHAKMWRDLYLGDGKDDPSVMVRMDRLERAQESFTHYARLILGTLVVTIAGLVINLLRK